MKQTIESLLPLWGIESSQLSQIYASAWEINASYIMKVYDDKMQLERNIKTAELLSRFRIPVAEAVPTKAGEQYVAHQNQCFFLSRKLPGSSISDLKDEKIAREMGCAIARLHAAFAACEKELEFWDNSLLAEMKGWVLQNLTDGGWQFVSEPEYAKAVDALEKGYERLPKQLIHRDVHFGNFLFHEGKLSGYIDFDLSQKNIRIFDICYFLTGLLTEQPLTKEEWLCIVRAVVAGYESVQALSSDEKAALPCVMECIEMLFVAYFSGINDAKCADNAYRIFRFIQSCFA